MVYEALALAVVALHLGWLTFIPLGGFLAWRWPWLVAIHLPSLALGLASVTAGFECPLTHWEKALRRRAGETPYRGGFIDHYLDGRLFPHGWDRPVQLLIAAVVVAAYVQPLKAVAFDHLCGGKPRQPRPRNPGGARGRPAAGREAGGWRRPPPARHGR